MSRGFSSLVFCAFKTCENGRTLNVMVRAFTRYIDDLSKSRQATIPKAWHVHGNITHLNRSFLPRISKSG
jgi:hypothetical protein